VEQASGLYGSGRKICAGQEGLGEQFHEGCCVAAITPTMERIFRTRHAPENW